MKNYTTNPPHIVCNDRMVLSLKSSTWGEQTYTSPTDGLLTVGNNQYDGAIHEFTAKLTIDGNRLKWFCGSDMRVTHAIVEFSVTKNERVVNSGGFLAVTDNIYGQIVDKFVGIGAGNKVSIDVTKILQDILDGKANSRDICIFRQHALNNKLDYVMLATEKNENPELRPCLRMDFVSSRLNTEDMAYASASAGRAGNSKVNLQTGRLVWEHPDMSVHKNGANLDISHVYNDLIKGVTFDQVSTGEKTPEFNCGNRFKLNIQQYLLKTDRAYIDGGVNYIYIDGDGNHHDFVNKCFYVDADGEKHFVELKDCADDINGNLMFDGHTVERCADNVSGMKLDLNSDALGLALRLPQESTHYYTIQSDGTLKELFGSVSESPNIFKITEYAAEPQIRLDNKFDITEIEQYKNAIKNCQSAINNLNIQISTVKASVDHYQSEMDVLEQKQDITEDEAKLFREYESQAIAALNSQYSCQRQVDMYEKEMKNAKSRFNEAVEIKKREPIDFITDADGNVLGFDYYGRLVLVSDGSESNVALILYDENGVLKSVADKDGNELVKFDYKDGLLQSMTDYKGDSIRFAYTDGALVNIAYADGEKSSFEYSDGFMSKATGIAYDSAVFARNASTKEVIKITEQSALARVLSTSADEIDGDVLKLSEISIDYSSGFQTIVSDGVHGGSKTYIFDLTGRPVTLIDKDVAGVNKSTAVRYHTVNKIFDCVHIKKARNIIRNGKFTANGSFWETPSGASFSDSVCINGSKCVNLPSGSIISQDLPLSSGITPGMYILSAWAKAKALNIASDRRKCSFGSDVLGARVEELADSTKLNRAFCITAELMRGETSVAKYVSSFDSYNEDWQCTSLPIKLDRRIPFDRIRLSLVYSGNIGEAQFADCSFVMGDDFSLREYDEGTLISERTEKGLFEHTYTDGRLVETAFTNKSNKAFMAEYKYDGKGRPIFAKDFDGNCTQIFFDDNGNVAREERFNIKDPALKYVNEYEYDKDGNVISQSMPTGDKIVSTYRNGVKVEESDGDGVTAYGYDRLACESTGISGDADGEENANKLTYNKDFLTKASHNGFDIDYEYDGKGRILKTSLDGDAVITNTYVDATETGGDGTATSTFYGNAENESVQITTTTDTYGKVKIVADQAEETPLEQNTYDGDGNITQKVDGFAGITYAYTHNDDGITGVSYSLHDQTVEVKRTFINADIETGSYVKIATTTRSTYNDANISLVTGKRVVTSQRFSNGINVCKQFDALGRARCREHKDYGSQTTLMTEERNYYKRGERTCDLIASERYGINGNLTEHIKYSYDNRGNISEIRENGKLTTRYFYDSLNRLVREDNKAFGKTTVFTYDVGGNIMRKAEYDLTLGDVDDKTPVSENVYSYRSLGWKDVMTAFDGEACVYDVLGRPTTYRNSSLGWNKYGMLTTLGDNISYAYNIDGIRISKTVDGVTTKFFTDGAKILKSTVDSGADIWYNYTVDGIHGITVTKDNTTTEYVFRRNAQGDVTHIYKLNQDKTLSLAAEYKYDAWGKCEVEEVDGSGIGALNPIRYRGYYFDTETGLYYLNARYYDPETGRFISADDTKFLDPHAINGLNLFAYCGNNPVMNVDPTGRWFFTLLAILGAITISATVSGVVNGVSEYLSGGSFWHGFVGGFITGAVSAIGVAAGFAFGGIPGLVIAGVIGAVGGMAGNVVQQGLRNDWKNISFGEMFLSGAISGLSNALSLGITKAIASGANIFFGTSFIEKFVNALKFNPYTTLVGGGVFGFPIALLGMIPSTIWGKYA